MSWLSNSRALDDVILAIGQLYVTRSLGKKNPSKIALQESSQDVNGGIK